MNYALAKKLKDAGYPQPLIAYTHMWKRDGSGVKAYCPDLEELIMKCGDGHLSLLGSEKDGYVALLSEDNVKHALGKTPIEAVANLWLEINK